MMHLHPFRILLISSLMAAPPLNAQQKASIVVHAGDVLGPVDRLVFGHNLIAADNAHMYSSDTTDPNLIQRGDGIWDPDNRIPVKEVIDASKSVGMSMLRYPGGCYAHNFDWRKTVGPDAKKNGWLFGLDEYLKVCSAIGASPLITVSDYVLPADQMPQNAAELVEYLNSPADAAHPWAMKRKDWGHPDPYNVRWFELGNESDHGNHRVLPHRQYTAEEYAAYANATAAAMRKVDPRIKLGIVMIPGPGNDVDCDWNHTVVRLAGKSADFVVIHMYAPQEPKTGVSEDLYMGAMMSAPQQVEEHLAEYHRMFVKQLGHDLPLAITEYNGALDTFGSRYRFSFGDALECADLVRVFLKPESKVVLANYFQFVNGYYGMVWTNMRSPDGEPITKEPALLLYQLWAAHFGSKLLDVQTQSPKANFAGAGSEAAAFGSVPEPRRQIQPVDLAADSPGAESLWPKLSNIQIQRKVSDFTIHLDHLSQSTYPLLAQIPRPAIAPGTAVEFTISFDAKFTPDPGGDSTPMGIGLMDSRGWNATHSGIGLDTIGTDWQHFESTYQLTPQTSSVDLSARLLAGGKNVSGTLQVRKLGITAYVSAHDAAYPLLTASASTSSDGSKLFLMVFNKDASTDISTSIDITGFPASKAQYWVASAPGLSSLTSASLTADGADFPLKTAGTATHTFPAHSMTAVEFTLRPK